MQVTHPFHPRCGEVLAAVSIRAGGREDRVYYYEEDELRTIPVSWTSLAAPDPVAAVSGGRSLFRAEDLLELARQIGELKAAVQPSRRGRSGVKQNTPHM